MTAACGSHCHHPDRQSRGLTPEEKEQHTDVLCEGGGCSQRGQGNRQQRSSPRTPAVHVQSAHSVVLSESIILDHCKFPLNGQNFVSLRMHHSARGQGPHGPACESVCPSIGVSVCFSFVCFKILWLHIELHKMERTLQPF